MANLIACSFAIAAVSTCPLATAKLPDLMPEYPDYVMSCNRLCDGLGVGCKSAACAMQCLEPRVCYNNRHDFKGQQCCCPNLGIDVDKKCSKNILPGACQLRCCFNSSVQCDGGCCKAKSNGFPQHCGVLLHPEDGKSGCCTSTASSPEEQTKKGCCAHEVGKDCTSPGQNKRCCLSLYEFSACQSNCTGYKPQLCKHGQGVDCRAALENPAAAGKNPCCLKQGSPPAHDWCQKNMQLCTTFYSPCADDQTGQDCSSSDRGMCCLPDPEDKCRKNCFRYDMWYRFEILLCAFVAIFTAYVLLVCLCQLLYQANIRSPGSCVYIACVLSCSDYPTQSGKCKLKVNTGPRKLVSMMINARYDVRYFEDATSEDMKKAVKHLMTRTKYYMDQTESQTSFVYNIVWCGHGEQHDGSQLWIGRDYTPEEPKVFHLTRDLVTPLSDIDTDAGAERYKLKRPVDNAEFVIWCDCCRTVGQRGEAATLQDEDLPSEPGPANHWRQPRFYYIFSTAERQPAHAPAKDYKGSTCFMSATIQAFASSTKKPMNLEKMFQEVKDNAQKRNWAQQVETRGLPAASTTIYMTQLCPREQFLLRLSHARNPACECAEFAWERLKHLCEKCRCCRSRGATRDRQVPLLDVHRQEE